MIFVNNEIQNKIINFYKAMYLRHMNTWGEEEIQRLINDRFNSIYKIKPIKTAKTNNKDYPYKAIIKKWAYFYNIDRHNNVYVGNAFR